MGVKTLPKPDFSGYATKADLKCSDGRVIMPDAFAHQDKIKVPLIWAHDHKNPDAVLGHAILEKRTDGMYCYAFFNETAQGQNSKMLVQHGDVESLSIWANDLSEKVIAGAKQVWHGAIREVSLVLSGANPGAKIDNVAIAHSDGEIEELADVAIIYTGLPIEHSEMPTEVAAVEAGTEDVVHEGEPTVQEVYDSLDDVQKDVVEGMIAAALETKTEEVAAQGATTTEGDLVHKEGTEDMTRNVFETEGGTKTEKPTLSHDQLKAIHDDAIANGGTFKKSLLAHAVEYGIENIDFLFPDARAVDNAPELVSRRMEWVNTVITGVRKSPFSRIKSLSADITHDEARAKGYIKGNLKKDEFFALAKRVTTPQTIYKKQKLDRDDIIDITDLDVVAWLKAEMRIMLDEEIARAILIGDGREIDDEDKINETMIRPIAQDDNFYAHQVVVASNITGDAYVDAVVRARKNYRGAGNPTMFCSEDFLADLLLIKDNDDHRLYKTEAELATALRVKNIVEVPLFEDAQTSQGDLLAIFVNLSDYTVGADKGGNVTMFDDFDIDYNQYKYLIEGRMSGALTKFKTALVLTQSTASGSVTPTAPTFNNGTGVITIPSVTGVVYKNAANGNVLSSGAQSAIGIGTTFTVDADPAPGYQFPHNFDEDWSFTRTA